MSDWTWLLVADALLLALAALALAAAFLIELGRKDRPE